MEVKLYWSQNGLVNFRAVVRAGLKLIQISSGYASALNISAMNTNGIIPLYAVAGQASGPFQCDVIDHIRLRRTDVPCH